MGESSPKIRAAFSRSLLLSALGFLFLLSSCLDEGPTGPGNADLEMWIVQGDGQAAGPGALLPQELKVRVQRMGSGTPVAGVRVHWETSGTGGGTVSPQVTETDSLGLALAGFTFGPSLGLYKVQASVQGMASPPAEFLLRAILEPELSHLSSGPVEAGDTILISGLNFSSDPHQNLVTFSGVRGQVVSAAPTELQVEVPPCLMARAYQVRVRIGSLATDPKALEVVGAPATLSLGPGEDRILDASSGFGCIHLESPPGGGLYLLVPHSTSTVSGAGHEFSLLGLTSDGVLPLASEKGLFAEGGRGPNWMSPAEMSSETALSEILDAQDRMDEKLRALEEEFLPGGQSPVSPGIRGAPELEGVSDVPELGDRRAFQVLNIDDKFTKIWARVRYISDHALVYVEEDVPAGGFTELDLEAMVQDFDNPVYPVITEAFGHESDLDDNDRVIILLTTAVNRLTPPGSSGFVGGFFFGLDLLPERSGSNKGEIFYALVPDPGGQEGPVISRQTALNTIPAVLAHEFEHMVHFNQRMLLRGAASQEALWLSEALAQMAEDLVGQAFENAHQLPKAYQYRAGNWIRAQRFLNAPGQVSVLASLSPGTLAERGAGWLLLKQVLGRTSQEGFLANLVSTVASGIENLTGETGLPWETLVADWAGSLYLDGTGVPVRPGLNVAGVNLRDALSGSDGSYPLRALAFGGQSALFSGSLWPSAPNYFIISPPAGGGVALSASGPMTALPDSALGLQVLVVRLQ